MDKVFTYIIDIIEKSLESGFVSIDNLHGNTIDVKYLNHILNLIKDGSAEPYFSFEVERKFHEIVRNEYINQETFDTLLLIKTTSIFIQKQDIIGISIIINKLASSDIRQRLNELEDKYV